MLRQRSEKCVAEGSKYAHWIGLYLSFYLSWLLGPFAHGRLQNLKTSEDTFGHGTTPSKLFAIIRKCWWAWYAHTLTANIAITHAYKISFFYLIRQREMKYLTCSRTATWDGSE